ncbi:MAG TPA: BamA/TamA family outer membrane protein, partial [Chitinophagaceae bacterium]|nr:BamA/TamA family outer membrane protein [Chitinophagaceae bacterium]
MNCFKYIFILASSVFLIACSNTRKLPAGDALYLGAKTGVKDDSLSAKKRKSLREDLTSLTRPRPNSKILGVRVRLFFYNLAGNPRKEKSIKGWLKYKVGEPPVLLSDVNLERNIKVLQNSLENRGFFKAYVEGDTVVKNKKATAIYRTRPGIQYLIAKVNFPTDSTGLGKIIAASADKTILKPGEPFDLSVIKGERERIDNYVKEKGFYYFDPDFVIIQVDSTIGNHKVNLFVKVKPNIPPEAGNLYTINEVYILPNYRLNARAVDTVKSNAEYFNGYYVIDKQQKFKLRLFSEAMQFNPGDVYNRTDHTQTISRLVNLGLFKFVKNRFEPVSSVDTPRLNVYYYLTPLPKKSIRTEINASTKSNNLTGSSITVGWRNRNTFRGGELLSIEVTGGFEVQFSGLSGGYNTYRGGIENSLTYPRFLTPFFTINTKGGYIPRTKISLSYEILNKQKLYIMNSFRAGFGYAWKKNIQIEHHFNPVAIDYVQPLLITQLYKDSMANNPSLQKAVETQFILGSNYNYTYNELQGNRPMSGMYFSVTADLSGNIAGLATGANIKTGNPKEILGARFSQYVKMETDFRYYVKISKTSTWANRLIVGVGIPYGNSLELPFIKQFFVGGNNSIRAFRSRSLGPGTYQAPPSNTFLPDQSGDIKMEINTELRAKLFSIVHGAIFADA